MPGKGLDQRLMRLKDPVTTAAPIIVTEAAPYSFRVEPWVLDQGLLEDRCDIWDQSGLGRASETSSLPLCPSSVPLTGKQIQQLTLLNSYKAKTKRVAENLA